MIQVDTDRGVPETLRVARTQPLLGEALIDAQEAAEQLLLQRYWLTHPKERLARRIPYYRIGRMVRFRLSELTEWMSLAEAARDRSFGP